MKRFLAAFALVLCVAPLSADAAVRPYASGAVQGATTIEIGAGQSKQVTLKFKNAGSYVWRGNGARYVSLYATGPYKRLSAFRDASWPTKLQPTTLQQALVRPGEVGSVTFTLHAPDKLGTYDEQFQLAAEDIAWVYGSVARLSINVVAPKAEAVSVAPEAHMVMDAETGEVLDERNADDVRSIASITKLMTVMVAHELGTDENTVVALAKQDEVGGGRLQVPVGTALSVKNLAASAIVGSANNAANAVARATGFPRAEFVKRMDEKARALGLAHTRFADPTGIEVENLSTAREVALMAKAAFADPWIAPFAGAPTYDVVMADGAVRTIKNTNALVHDGAVVVGAGKTGFIYEAGYTLVTRLEKPGERDLLVVVLGSETKARSFAEAKALAQKVWARSKTASR